MSTDDSDDRRRAERIPVNEEFSRLPETTFISDLSEYGAFVQTRHPPQLGTMILLRFTVLLEDPVVIEAMGKVVRHGSDPRGMGVEFTDLAPEMLLKINDVMASQTPRESGPPVGGEPGFDGAQTTAKGQIPIKVRARSGEEDTDEGNTNRYPAVSSGADPAGSASGPRLLHTGEYEVVEGSSANMRMLHTGEYEVVPEDPEDDE